MTLEKSVENNYEDVDLPIKNTKSYWCNDVALDLCIPLAYFLIHIIYTVNIYIYIYNFELAVMPSSLEYDLDVDNSEKD